VVVLTSELVGRSGWLGDLVIVLTSGLIGEEQSGGDQGLVWRREQLHRKTLACIFKSKSEGEERKKEERVRGMEVEGK
jgi:hypothetical protein